MKVLKFGGTSVGSPETIRVVKKIVESQTEPCAVVVSAFGGITDKIILTSRKAMEHDPSYKDELFQISTRHFDTINALLEDEQNREHTLKEADAMINAFQDILHGVYLLEDLSDKTMDFLLSFGERLSAMIISRLINNAVYIDSRKMVRTNSHFLNATVDFQITEEKIRNSLENLTSVAVIPGFIASDEKGRTTTLGRGGSDYTAAIIAAAMKASFSFLDCRPFFKATPICSCKICPSRRFCLTVFN